ncbi:single-stranded DNA-binding protein [Desulfosoma caldarium]|uniref:Single-stranded DNA-binding protein n=1 Tax=Desulfosoma caldarium TaxID=610254 RepID=A0A3N1UTK4_9BACT|nr:single-stranded DNA-binding protein [Desulfosoma caldarium]ROQ91181.1 single-strand binding protein [Desulfosoma caldarium]
MARTLNKVILIGRLGADPDVRYTQSGLPVVRFNLATNERVPAGEGNWEDRTEWHRIVVFGKAAENCANYLSKGRLVYVEGRLRTNQWEDAQGIRRYTTEIVASDVGFLDSGRDAPVGAETGQAPLQRGSREQPRPEEPFPDSLPEMSEPHDNDNIPF